MQSTLITREIVNKNIIFDKTHNYNDLCTQVDKYKNLLTKKYNVSKGDTIMNALKGYDATALFIASSELGMITIVASVTSYSKRLYYKKDRGWIDAKTLCVMPINYIVTANKKSIIELSDDDTGKGSEEKFYTDISHNHIDIDEVNQWVDTEPNNIINATPDSVLMLCTSSGTTGSPKKIQHTHDFMCRLGKRNSHMFYGSVVTTRKFMHGSSFATFFLPTLMSDDVTDIRASGRHTQTLDDVDHVQFPYTEDIEQFINGDINFPKLNVYTLAAIRPEWKNGKVKNIISLYGMSETSGPVMINTLNDDNFAPNKFYPIDNFYKLEIKDGLLCVDDLQTSDKFSREGNRYVFYGRDDLIRINDVEVPVQEYQSYIGNGTLVIDFLYNKIYLAMWDESIDIDKVQSKFDRRHVISKSAVLKKPMFMSGIKLDIQALREYFRSGILLS